MVVVVVGAYRILSWACVTIGDHLANDFVILFDYYRIIWFLNLMSTEYAFLVVAKIAYYGYV